MIIFILASLQTACNQDQASSTVVEPDVSVEGSESGVPVEEDDPLKELEEQGKLPTMGGGGKGMPVLAKDSTGSSGSLNLFPPNIDTDQDNIPEVAVTGHPEIKVDNCPGIFNPTQDDADGDGTGDACQ